MEDGDRIIRINVISRKEPEYQDIIGFLEQLEQINAPEMIRLKQFSVSGIVSIKTDPVPGISLQKMMAERGVFPIKESVKLICTIATTVDSFLKNIAGQSEELHCFYQVIPPASLVIQENGSVMIDAVDLYVRKRLSRILSREMIQYSAPGVLQGEVSTGEDICYSLGLMLFQLLTGRFPFEEQLKGNRSDIETLHVLLNPTIEPPQTADNSIPDQLSEVVMGVLKREVDSIEAFKRLLNPFLSY